MKLCKHLVFRTNLNLIKIIGNFILHDFTKHFTSFMEVADMKTYQVFNVKLLISNNKSKCKTYKYIILYYMGMFYKW